MVTQRLVFFIGGFDPKGPSSFYQQYKADLKDHSERHAQPLSVGPRTRNSPHSHQWTVQSPTVQTQFDYLAWDDIVRQQWARSPAALTRQALGSLRDFVLTGAMRRLYRHSKNVVFAALFPYALVAGAVVAVALLAVALAAVLGQLGWATAPRMAATAVAAGLAGWAAYRWLRTIPSTWFLRVVAFARSYAGAQDPSADLQQRMQAWGRHICQQMQASHADEVLLVGYSAGSILSTGVMAHVLRNALPATTSRLSLLTLGNCIPVPAVLPQAAHLLRDLQTIDAAHVRWVDFTAPIDWGSFALTDPVTLFAGGQPSPQRRFMSPQFHLLFSPETYQHLKKDKYRVHKQYLQTTELPGAYDYFALTCGALSLQERFF
jgi:hypothetical protein